MSRVVLLAVLLPLAAPAQQQGPDDGVSVDQIENDFLERLAKAEQAKDWRTFFAHVQVGVQRKASKVVSTGKDRWVGMREYLAGRLSALPKDALDHYRLNHDGPAAADFARARESGTRRDLERAADTHFFTSTADDVIDLLAQSAFDEGRPGEAAALWTRLLRYYPDPDAPPAVLAARAAQACVAAHDESALEDLRRVVAEKKVAGPIRVGGKDMDIQAFLAAAEIVPVPPPSPPVKEPSVRLPRDRGAAVANDIKRWTYDFSADRGEAVAPPPPPAPPRRGVRVFPNNNQGQVPPSPDYPFFPAYARIRGRDYVVFTDGARVVAVDPARVRAGSNTAGVYWKRPENSSILRSGAASPQAAYGRPYAGVAIDGEHAFVTSYSRLESRPRDPGQQDGFEGLTAIKCIHVPTGNVLWDTDAGLLEESKKLPFYEKPFSFTGPPIISGGRVFIGVCSSPAGEQEAWTLCLDRATGRPVWSTPLATLAAAGGGRMAMFMARGGALFQTTLAVQGGTVYAQTNIGAVAALSAVTGDILWLSRYPRTGMRVQNTGVMDYTFIRAANWPVLWKGRIYLLPQDRADLLAFETSAGRPVALPPLRVLREERPVEVRELHQLLGVLNDWLVIGGQQTHVIRLRDFTAFTLAASDTHASGRGVFHEGQVYLPVCSTGTADEKSLSGPQAGVLGVYAPPPSWRCTGQFSWKGPSEYGNLLVAGDALIVATDRLCVYTGVETIRREYAQRLAASPPRADVLLEFGDAMRENDRLEEAAEAYLGFIRAAEGDVRWEGRVQQVKRDLHQIFLRRGDETADPAKAMELFAYAKSFAYDEASRAEATRRLAGTYEKTGRWKDAVAQYQELIERARAHYHRQGEEVRKLWQHARERVDDIVKKAPEAYEDVEKRAGEALEKARDGGEEALRAVLDKFPNSKSARDAWGALRDRLRKEGGLERLRGLYKDFEERFKESLDFDAHKELLELLEKLKDGERMRFELDQFEAKFGERAVGPPGSEETVKAWVEKRRSALSGRPQPGPRKPGPVVAVADLDPYAAPVETDAAGTGLVPLRASGVEPAGLPAEVDFFARGSSVELWDVRAKKRLWARPKFGAWAGFTLSEKDVVTRVVPGSPAEKAGLRLGDLLTSVDGMTDVDAAQRRMADRDPDASMELSLTRAGQPVRARIVLGAPPAEMKPSILGAAWTRDGSFAVVWEDGAAAFDPVTGATRWVFRDVAAGAALKSFRAVDGRLALYEVEAAAAKSAEGPRARLIALNDFTGDVAWAYAMDVEPAPQGTVDVEVRLFGRALGSRVGLLQTVARGGGREEYLWTFPADRGGKPDKRSLPGRMVAHAVDEERGVFYAVCEVGDRQDRILLSRPLEPDRKDFKAMDIPLKTGELSPPGAPAYTLAVEGDIVCVLAVAGPEYRIRVFKAGQQFRALSLLEGRTLPPQGAPSARLEGGLLAVYNVPREAGGEARAFLTAFRPDAADVSALMLWDAPAPVAASAGAAWSFASNGGRLLGLSSLQGAAPGRPADGGVAAVYDLAAEGYLRLVRSPLSGAPQPVLFSRGRMYVMTREKTEAYRD